MAAQACFVAISVGRSGNPNVETPTAIDPEETTSQNTNKFVRWYSNGYIQIQLSPEGSEDATLLTAGKYTETIYIHVVSPE